MKRKTFLLICAVLIVALLVCVLAACDPGSKEQGGTQTPGGTQLPGNGGGGGTQTPGDNDQDDEQGGEVIEPAKLIFEKTDAGYSVTGYEGTPTVVVIPETYEGLPVTSIGWSAFASCTSLTSVTIPDSVTSIGFMTFAYCPSLERLTVAPGNPVYRSAGNCIIETETGTLIQGCNNSVIPSDGSVMSIGSGAFAGCTSLTSITIPESVTSIRGYAFALCPSLERLTIAPGNPKYHSAGNCVIETATDTLVQGCKDSIIPADGSVKSIGSGAFAGCTSLTSITIPESVTSIEDYAFQLCYKLVEVYNKSSLNITAGSLANGYVGEYAKHVYTEEGGSWLTDTEDGFRFFWDGETGYLVAYLGSETELTLPDSFTAYDGTVVSEYQINDYAFYGCDSLTSVTIGNSVTSIGMYAFGYCDSLTSVTIGNGVTSIGFMTFAYCPSLERLTVAPGNPVYRSAGNCIIETETGTLIQGCNNSVIPSDGSVTSIGDYAFAYCTSLASVTIPDSVTSIGRYSFADCAAEIIWGGTPTITEIGGYAFAGYAGTSITIPDSVTSMGNYAFSDCTSLTSVTIGDSVTSIGDSAFRNCDALEAVHITDIGKWAAIEFGDSDANPLNNGAALYLDDKLVAELVIPDSVTSIGEYAFRDCTSLTSITIPDSVTSIGWAAFADCYKLVEVYNKSSLDITVGSSSYGYVGYYAKHVYTEENDSWLTDTENGFRFLYDGETGYLVAYLGNETELTLPESFIAHDGTEVTSYQIYDYAFYGRDDLAAVTIPGSVRSIGEGAFEGCSSLTSITIPDSVTSIGISAFRGCTSLVSVTIPDSVTSIGSSAFVWCTAEIIWGGTPTITEIGDYAFAHYDGTSITIPDSVTSIGNCVIYSCFSLTSVTIPDSVESIGFEAFYGCDSLALVTFEGTMAEWEAVEKANDWARECLFTEVVCSDGVVEV